MTRRRWIADQAAGDRAALVGSNAAHLARVLRARVGQQFEISVGDRVRLGRVLAVTEQRVDFELGDDVTSAVESAAGVSVTLYLAVFKFDRMEWAIEKATELGVEAIVPVIARRTDSHLAQAAARRVERWRRLAHEAAQQSRRASPPGIAAPVALKDIFVIESGPRPPSAGKEDVPPTSRRRALDGEQEIGPRPPSTGLRIVLAETERDRTPSNILQPCHPDPDPERSEGEGEGPALLATKISLAVGPEGGWTADELQAFDQAGWQRASLGPRILRAETAAIAALAVVMMRQG